MISDRYDEDYEKKMAYIRLRSKMESILNKALSLNVKEDNLNSSLKMALTIDDNVFEHEEFDIVTDNTSDLINDIHETLSNINSRI